MTMIKRIAACFLAVLLLCCGLVGCGEREDSRLTVVCTGFPQYDWTRQIVGERTDAVNVILLTDSGADIHNYQPSARDIITLVDCDLLVYSGGESEEWVAQALADAEAKAQVVSLLEVLADAAKLEESVAGMQTEENEPEEPEYDEHTWLSLRCARLFCGEIAARLGELDAEGAQVYAANAAAYCAELDMLDRQYADAVENAAVKTVVFADRFPFRYLVDDYGLDYFAAFNGCSAETEAGFETVVFLADKLDELGIHSVIVLEKSDCRIADTVIEASKAKNQQIVTMNSMQSVAADDLAAGASYLGYMQDNLEALAAALGTSADGDN